MSAIAEIPIWGWFVIISSVVLPLACGVLWLLISGIAYVLGLFSKKSIGDDTQINN